MTDTMRHPLHLLRNEGAQRYHKLHHVYVALSLNYDAAPKYVRHTLAYII